MSVAELERQEEQMPVSNETIIDVVGYPEQSPSEAAEQDIRDILASYKGDLASIASTLLCGAALYR